MKIISIFTYAHYRAPDEIMIRTIITPHKRTVSLDLPVECIGKQIEIIAFAKEEGFKKERKLNKKVSFTILHVDSTDYKFNRDEANER
jgi:hypothetical protein